ncbi:hypothetical protein ACR77J_07750 [Tissierella praeacuta]|uniref:hypothetical protein n=1 Tax=Tissierella praeacuta TaxID=43131 RepID=UPI003DA482EA
MRKYDRYVIEIIHLNGGKQIRKAEDSSDYRSTISLYREIKENSYNSNTTINLVGISDSERGLIFTKRNSAADNQKKNIKELIDIIHETSIELNQQLKNISDMVDLSNKRKNGLEHLLVEAVDTECLTEEQKIDIFNQMRETILTRRDYKILDSIRQQTQKDIGLILKLIKQVSNTYDETIKINANILKELIENDDTKYKEVHLIREYEYKNHKERINLMSQLKGKYDRIANLEDRKVLACYNKCKSA